MSVRDGGCEAKSFAVGAGAFEFVDCVGRTVRALKATGGAASVDGDSEDRFGLNEAKDVTDGLV